ncbi:MAG TPA: sigma-70 family RNA polymerase sigma factor [Actinophytocola sp.]|jgi:RNA polymerase sigma factor (sigma-70 family)|nr:sigma-70 family RNA polymerase sigma factor [Actinophytocola sp.]
MGDSNAMGTLVRHAVRGDESAWSDIVRSYTPLLSAVCRRHGLSGVDADDVGGRVWLHLLTNISRLREPAALPGWLQTTTRRECQAVLRDRGRHTPLAEWAVADPTGPSADSRLLAAERRIALERAIAGLCTADRRLLALLFSDPPTPYAEISRTLGLPVGAIGPTRQRILKRLRQAHVWRCYRPTV